MKILLISTNFSPELTGIGKFSGEMSYWLSNNNNNVRVVCSPPYYPEWKVHNNFTSWRYKKEKQGNLCVYRCPIWVPKKATGLKRLIHLFSFSISSLPIVLGQFFWKPDIVICVEPSLFNSFGSLVISKICRSKSILHIQDFEVDAAFDLGIINLKWLKTSIYMIERFLMNRFDCISTISMSMLDRLVHRKIPNDKLILFPNWVDTNFIYPLSDSSFRQELNISKDTIVALYSGNIGEKQGLEIVIDSARLLVDYNILFIICGAGAARDRLQQQASDLTNIIWLPLQPVNKLNELLNLANIHLLPQQAGAADLVMPSKLTGMLSSGIPIVATASQGTEVYRVLFGIAEVTNPGDPYLFAKAITKLASDSSLRARYGQAGRAYALEYLNFDSIMKRFQAVINRLVVF